MSDNTIPPTPPSPGVAGRKKGPKTLPRLPLSAFSPPNSGTNERFELPPSPSTVHPTNVVDANVTLPEGGLSQWVSEAGQVLGDRIGGVVVSLKGKDQDVEKMVTELGSNSKIPVISFTVPFILGDPVPASPPVSLSSEKASVSLATVYSKPVADNAILKWALEQGRPVDIDVQVDLTQSTADWEKFEDLLTKATGDIAKPAPIILSNLLPPPHDLSLQIVKLMGHPTYRAYQSYIAALSLFPNLYIKYLPPGWDAVSLAASDNPDDSENRQKNERKRRIKMYLGPVVEAFGFSRIIFGSSSSVTPELKSSASDWYELARESLAELGVEQEAIDAVFSENAKKVYGRST